MTTRRAIFIVIGVLLIGAIMTAIQYGLEQISIPTPNYPKAEKAVWLEQNWKPELRDWYHSTSQGTVTFGIPYEWFVALEQPNLSLWETGLLKDKAYLDRLGFIASDGSDLPVGFAKGQPLIDPATGEHWTNPQTGADTIALGLNCAACHTGRLTYKGTEILIDGGVAKVEFEKLRKAIGLSLILTRYVPFRFDRFATRLLGEGASEEAKAQTRDKLDAVIAEVRKIQKLDASIAPKSIHEGYGRLDALNRIGNQVFGLDLDNEANYAPTSAPVRFPPIWDASWFDWVQYNSSIEQPMVRNAGEALGVRALINLVSDKQPLFNSSVDIKGLFAIETLLAGQQPKAETGFTGLHAPAWPSDILPPIDSARAAKGAELYKELCQGCHLPPVKSAAFFEGDWWTLPNAAGERYIILRPHAFAEIGTDPAQAEDMSNRKVATPAKLGISETGFGQALGDLVEKTVNHWYDSENIPGADRQKMNGYRENGIRAPLAYKARPLDGIWATAPYLHNGSVPNLYALLSPASERPAQFTLGHREFDPVNVGMVYDELPGGTVIDTSQRGNFNRGHEFNDDKNRQGVIGRKLSPEERRDLIEYLKTL